jgi:hypothetical protein
MRYKEPIVADTVNPNFNNIEDTVNPNFNNIEDTVNPNINVKTQQNRMIMLADFFTSLLLLVIPEDEFPSI